MGSSLRVRGAASIVGGALQGVGIIPAHAGSSILNAGTVELGRDHPRACGEQALTRGELAAVGGSSPRVRGAVRVHRRNERRPGIIPACAGSRRSRRRTSTSARDHPRAGGEQEWRHTLSFGTQGSSPRMRGAVLLIVTSPLDSGIIPACAGSSGCARGRCGARRGHPRVCGEQYLLSYTAMPPAGSSPRVRGAVHEVGRVAQAHGIIPACAGNRHIYLFCIYLFWDHPRACGEQLNGCLLTSIFKGSSPRVRGAEPRGASTLAQAGIIPARAGSSRGRSATTRPAWDHPRACGEQRLHTTTEPS